MMDPITPGGGPEYTHCLIHIQTFETLWAYYSQSGGEIYDNECRQSALSFLECLQRLTAGDGQLAGQLETIRVNQTGAGEILRRLEGWASSDEVTPFRTFAECRPMLFGLLSGLKLYIHVKLQAPITPLISMSAQEIEHSERVLRWKGYLPEEILMKHSVDPDELIREASGSRSIVVIGDIRRSQQLMAYARDTDGFTRFMGDFIELSRKLIQKHFGFFDKFTGDGFIAYFNEKMCGELGLDFVECFMEFVRQENKFVGDLFEDWRESVTQLPEQEVGLAMGCDIGPVEFRDVNNHLISVGDAVVWAHRMSSAGGAGDVIVHEPLVHVIKMISRVALSPRNGTTKNGMSYKACAMEFSR